MDKASFAQWKENPITIEVMDVIKQTRDAYRDAIIGHARAGEHNESIRAAGNIEGLDYLLNIQFEDQE